MFTPLVVQREFSRDSSRAIAAVAIVARIYTPYSSKRKSKMRLYLSGLHGEHLHVVEEATGDIVAVKWKSTDEVCWAARVLRNGNLTIGEFVLNLRSHKLSRKIKTTWDYSFWIPSFPLNEPVTSVDRKHPGTFGISTANNAWVYTHEGKTTSFQPSGQLPHGMAFSKSNNVLFYLDWTHDSTLGSHNSVYRFDWAARKPRLIFQEMDSFDLRPDRVLYASVDTRDLVVIGGNKKVWGARPWVGNWLTGKRWNPISGLIYAVSIAIRPVHEANRS